MRVFVNGEERNLSGERTVASLLEDLGLESRRVAVERNRDIVPKADYAKTPLSEGDRIEIVHFVGGG